MDETGILDYFCSFGLPPPTSVNTLVKTINQSQIRIQGVASNVCGQYCLYFLFFRSHGEIMADVMNHFSRTNYTLNDAIVEKFASVMFCDRDPSGCIDCLQSCTIKME